MSILNVGCFGGVFFLGLFVVVDFLFVCCCCC